VNTDRNPSLIIHNLLFYSR